MPNLLRRVVGLSSRFTVAVCLGACSNQGGGTSVAHAVTPFACAAPGTVAEYRVDGPAGTSPVRRIVAAGADPQNPTMCLSRTDGDATAAMAYGFIRNEWGSDTLPTNVSGPLRQFFAAGEPQVRFPGTIHGGWLDQYSLTRKGEETLDVGGKPMRTMVVERAFQGQSKFGEATYWIDPATGTVVRYRAGAGWPNPVRGLDLQSITAPRA